MTIRRLICALVLAVFAGPLSAQDLDPKVLAVEQERIAAIEKVRPAVVAIFGAGGRGGGSGVLISKDGYALTNYHVTAGAGITMKCGLPDGVLYDAVLVGLDRVGDVALIKLLPKGGKDFPFAVMADSDQVKAGEWSLAMGNPFLLATDFTPTVTFGLVSGVHRYQYPEGRGLLEYTDCIQIDTSINPGNSGGPLFNMKGELIGINGRGSFDKRGRVNSGVGYAISINQIKNFLGHLHAGLESDHATLGAAVDVARDDSLGGRLIIRNILEQSDAYRRGLAGDDELVEFAGRPMTSPNQFQNVLGIYPLGWRMPITYRRDNKKNEILVRLMGRMARELDEDGRPRAEGQPMPQPKPQPGQPKGPPAQPKVSGPAAKFYEKKAGFVNYYFNKQHQDRLLTGFKKHGDFAALKGEWVVEATADFPRKKGVPVTITIRDDKDSVVSILNIDGEPYKLEPLKEGQEARELMQPTGSGGLAMALYHYRNLLTQGAKGFAGQFAHGGHEPFYPPKLDGSVPRQLKDLRVETEVLVTESGAIAGKWYFSQKDQSLLGFEVTAESGQDPCEVYFYDYKDVNGRQLPHRFIVQHGNDRYGTFTVKEYKLK